MRTARILATLLSSAALSAAPRTPIRGRINRFDGKSHIDVRDDRRFIDTPYPNGLVPAAFPYAIGVGIGPVDYHYWH